MAIICPGCSRQFNSRSGLSTHQRYCPKIKDRLKITLKKRTEEQQERNFAKLQLHHPQQEALVLVERQELRNSVNDISEYPHKEASPGLPQQEREVTVQPEFHPSGRARRKTRLPARYRDLLPPAPPALPAAEETVPELPITSPVQLPQELPSNPAANKSFTTDVNSFGIFRSYNHALPSWNPDDLHTLDNISDSATFLTRKKNATARSWGSVFGQTLNQIQDNFFTPFLNATTYRLMNWFYSGSNLKSLNELDQLVHDVLLADDFNQDDLKGFRATKEAKRLDDDYSIVRSELRAPDGWIETSVKISLPADKVKHSSEAAAPQFEVGVYSTGAPWKLSTSGTATLIISIATEKQTKNAEVRNTPVIPPAIGGLTAQLACAQLWWIALGCFIRLHELLQSEVAYSMCFTAEQHCLACILEISGPKTNSKEKRTLGLASNMLL
ncbi:hypothetical protein BD779DRAFT_1476608 [Infundibulicybe gibba]|nr:hypothetical protein BD779DRAFT_1476608 [Infundibulicybe gibba]